MSIWSRVRNVFRSGAMDRAIDEELESHIQEAVDNGRDAQSARRALGPALRLREQSRDVKMAGWLDSFRWDVIFGWRQLLKNRAASGAAILSLALAAGACTSAFRLVDALLLRPLPVADPGNLYVLTHQFVDNEGKPQTGDDFEYPLFRDLRASVKGEAELLAISYAGRVDLTYGSDHDMEKAYRQYVSGNLFSSFGLTPAVGRLLTEQDDLKPGAHPYAVLSHDYWRRRFGGDPKAVGRTFRLAGHTYEIVGVVNEGFTGTETGTVTDIFTPTMMNARAINAPGWSWFRTWVRPAPATELEPLRQKLQAGLAAFRQERTKEWPADLPQAVKERYVNAPLSLAGAAAGVSGLQRDYRRSLLILSAVVLLVLLIACVNVANLLTVQAAARAREMALRISIGAGRARLVQLLLIESSLIAAIAAAGGALFAWWSAPFVVSMINPADNPARLILPADWRVLGFTLTLAASITFLFGMGPALRASGVQPVRALKGGENPHSRRRWMNGLIAAQVAFCFLVHFVAGLFVASFLRLANEPTGFAVERVLALEVVAAAKQAAASWNEVADRLKSTPGVESAAIASWALMSGNGWGGEVRVKGRKLDESSPNFLAVSPSWRETMEIPLIDGRDFRPEDVHPGAALVNEAFARRYFDRRNPVGESFEQMSGKQLVSVKIVGYVRDARYRTLRETIRPTVYVPFSRVDKSKDQDWATLLVRTAGDPLALAPALRQEVPRARSEFRVSGIRTQQEIVLQHTLRERLLAFLSLFFGLVAMALAAVGLYGVLNYSVLQQRREIGIRMALGAPAAHVARHVLADVAIMLVIGSGAGLAAGLAAQHALETLLYGVKATDIGMLALPVATILAAALLAAAPPLIRALRIEPALTLRSE